MKSGSLLVDWHWRLQPFVLSMVENEKGEGTVGGQSHSIPKKSGVGKCGRYRSEGRCQGEGGK